MKKLLWILRIFLFPLIFFTTVLQAEVPTYENVTRLYVATFNRAPDAEGLEYWVNRSNLRLEQIAQSFFDQPETQERYPSSTSDHDFIKAVYNNLFNRDPDSGGWSYWEQELLSKRVPNPVFILAVINGAQNTQTYGKDATILENKKHIGMVFAEAGMNNTDKAQLVMEGVTADPNSVAYIEAYIAMGELPENVWMEWYYYLFMETKTIYANPWAFVALRTDGSAVVWGNFYHGANTIGIGDALFGGIKQIIPAYDAFAAIKNDGSVLAWGSGFASDNSYVQDKLVNIAEVSATNFAFAALRIDNSEENGSVVVWGDLNYGGDISLVKSALSQGVVKVFSTDSAFAALKTDGSVVSWGDTLYGGDSSMVADQLQRGIVNIFSTESSFIAVKESGDAVCWGWINCTDIIKNILDSSIVKVLARVGGYSFAVLKEDGSVIAWDSGVLNSVTDKLNSNVLDIYKTTEAFAALLDDGSGVTGSVVVWGNALYGGDITEVADRLDKGVSEIFSTIYAFAALKSDGSVVTWGLDTCGGDSSAVKDLLKSDVVKIYSTRASFAALKSDGSAVTWGADTSGGDSSMVADKLKNGVVKIFSTDEAFAALKEDGTVITWGDRMFGGESSNFSDQLRK